MMVYYLGSLTQTYANWSPTPMLHMQLSPSHHNDLPKVDPLVILYDGSLPQFPWSDLC
jgi:hypothetical protein